MQLCKYELKDPYSPELATLLSFILEDLAAKLYLQYFSENEMISRFFTYLPQAES